MSEGFGGRTLKRKNVKGLALAAPAPKPAQSFDDNQIGGSRGGEQNGQTAQLEIGIEYKLDLKREDLEVLKELGSGNGGTVSKVKHIATGTVMARKVYFTLRLELEETDNFRSYMSKLRRKSDAVSFESFISCTSVILTTSSTFMVLSSARVTMLLCVWSTWMLGNAIAPYS
jgi:hypothetical protein